MNIVPVLAGLGWEGTELCGCKQCPLSDPWGNMGAWEMSTAPCSLPCLPTSHSRKEKASLKDLFFFFFANECAQSFFYCCIFSPPLCSAAY